MIVGEENCQAFSLDHITRFSNDEMFGKKIGLCTDLKGSRLSPRSIEWIKNQTGGDIIHAEVKNKRESYSYVSTCKYIIASNFRPDLGEDDALENRFLTIPFPNSVPDSQKNYHLLDDIKKEMQHVLYLVFQALRDFLENGMQFADIGDLEYYVPKSFTNEEDTVGDFFRECCYLQKDSKIGRTEVYERYLTYCTYTERQALNDTRFFKCFKRIMNEHDIRDDTNNGRRYKGLALKHPAI